MPVLSLITQPKLEILLISTLWCGVLTCVPVLLFLQVDFGGMFSLCSRIRQHRKSQYGSVEIQVKQVLLVLVVLVK
jgi:hypothetical protein